MRLSFSDKDLSQNKYIPFEGKFLVKIKDAGHKIQESGNVTINLELVGAGPDAGMTGKEFITVTPTTQWKAANLFVAAGFSQQDLKAKGGDPADLRGKVIIVHRSEPKKELYNGKERTNYKVNFYLPSPEQLAMATADDVLPASDIPDFGDTEPAPF